MGRGGRMVQNQREVEQTRGLDVFKAQNHGCMGL